MPLPALLLDGNFRIDSPVKPFAFLVSLDKSIMLAKVVTYARLPTTSRSLEFVPRILLLNVVVDLLEVHLTSRRGRDCFVNEHDIVRRRALQLLLAIILDTQLGRRSARRFDKLGRFLVA